ncbi:uncharacterized protein LOC117227859 [Megalopta genalis]|uniref:uncharacterized protein LOC117227859 n=1 Tax=Megalopta genalis TaxID=115081 RepID=UPI0014433755|nr:uncharacterized protein LOC117227859 [Megalopta genalis]
MPSCYAGETIIALSLSRFKRRHIRRVVAGSASSVPNTHDETAKRAGLRSSVAMGSIAFHIAAILLLAIGPSQARTSGRDLSKASGSQLDALVAEPSPPATTAKEEPRKEDAVEEPGKENVGGEDQLPILPPIILLDFGNNTDEENATSEEKSKRTVNGGLGYGLDKNSLQPRRYNYYFPAGKSGTTVSIEESISPFLPKTIVEKVQPAGQKGYYLGSQQNSFAAQQPASQQTQKQSSQSLQFLNTLQTMGQFGLRTKPHASAAGLGSYQKPQSTPKPALAGSLGVQNTGHRSNEIPSTTQSPLAFSPTETVRYVTPSPASFASPQAGSFHYARQGALAASYAQRQQSNINSQGFGSAPQSVESSTISPVSYNPRYQGSGQQAQPPGPRYSLENGVRYENKVFWKYPDGRVSDVPPATYVETYSRYPEPDGQPARSQAAHSVYEVSSTENSVYSQGPVQFPAVSEQAEQEPNQFVSSESLTGNSPQQQVFRHGYQALAGQRQNQPQQRKPAVATSYSFATSGRLQSQGHKVTQGSLYQPVTSRYMVNGPDPEYTADYTTESAANITTPNFFASLGEQSSRLKYTHKVQNYLDSALSESEGSKRQSLPNNDLNSYSNLQYSDLLNYNPSISEYIRNPSSILNVRPTFVQAGNSLIPVIILRVDGVSPIQAKAGQNINLKALLQQYLIQYANSIQDLARPSTYNLGTESIANGQSQAAGKSPILDLIRLTQEDARNAPPVYDPNDYVGRSSYETSNLEFAKSYADGRYGDRAPLRQKTKSVQIVDDPRFTSYKTKN